MKVGIVGYGPAANVLAVSLYKQGHSVTIYERNQSPYDLEFETMKNRSYPLLFNAKAGMILERVGILPYFTNMKHCNQFLKIKLPAGDIKIEGEPNGYQGSWNGIMKAMLDSFQDLCPDAELIFKTPVVGVDIQEGMIRTEKESRRFDLIVGCDGVGSIVRSCGEEQNKEFKTEKFQFKRSAKTIWMNADVQREGIGALWVHRLGPGFLSVYSKDHNNELMLGLIEGELKLETPEAVKAHVKKYIPHLYDSIPEEEFQQFVERPLLNIGRKRIANFYKLSDKVAIVGDSAHAFPPAGIGATLAMGGAENLAQQIKLHSDDLPLALKKYSEQHKLEADGAVYLGGMNRLAHLILTIYFKVLGSIPSFIIQHIQHPVLPYEDSCTYVMTSMKIAEVFRVAVFLSFLFAMLVIGTKGVLKLIIDLLFLFALLNWLTMQKDFVRYFVQLKRAASFIGTVSFLASMTLYLLFG